MKFLKPDSPQIVTDKVIDYLTDRARELSAALGNCELCADGDMCALCRSDKQELDKIIEALGSVGVKHA